MQETWRQLATAAWMNAKLQRSKRIPPIDKLLGKRNRRVRRLTAAERAEEWQALNKL